MKRILNKRLPAFLLAVIMAASLTPAAMADTWSNWVPQDAEYHYHVSTTDPTKTEKQKHTFQYVTSSSDSSRHWQVCSLCGYETAHVSHTWDSGWKYDASNHWHVCTICEAREDLGGHVDANNDGRCDTCNYSIPANTVTVTFISSAATFATQTVSVGSSPVNPGTPTKTASGKTYAFKGWTTENPRSSALYTGQSFLTAAQLIRTTVTQDITYYALFTESSAADITYDVDPGGTVKFNRNDFEDFFEEQRSGSDSLRYVRFRTDSSLKDSVGVVYYDYRGDAERSFDRTRLENYDFYYRSDSYGSYPISGLSFAAASRADGKTVTMDFTAYGNNSSYSGSLLIRVGEVVKGVTGDITYKVDPGKSVSFSRNDFEDFFDDEADRDSVRDSLRYITFQTDSSLRTSNGTIYYDYEGREEESFDRDELEDSRFYFSSRSYGDYPISGMSFAASTRGDGNVVTLGFTAYGSSKHYSGSLIIRIGDVDDEASGDINYKVAPGKSVSFTRSDFNSYYREKYSGSVSYVTFTASSLSGGTLSSGSRTFTRSNLSSYSFYYSSANDGDYALNSLTFEADSDFKDEVTLNFRAYGNDDRDYVTGAVVIRSTSYAGSSANAITYSVKIGNEVAFKRSDFKAIADKKLDGAIRYVTFTTSDALSSGNGAVYYNYGRTGEKEFSRTTIDDFQFYYSSTAYGDYALDDLSFVAPRGAGSRTVTLNYVIYDSYGDSVKGAVEIKVGQTSTTDNPDITYKVSPSREITFNREDFNDFYQKQSKTSNTIRYVTFTTSDALSKTLTGMLYYNYGQGSERSFTNTDLQDVTFYYSSASDGDYPLNSLSFVASSRFASPITLEFTAWYSSSRRERGTLVIQPDSTTVVITSVYSGNIRYQTSYDDPVRINADEISRFFRKQYPTGQLLSVHLDGVPSTGTLYYNYYGTSTYGSTVRKQLTASNYTAQDFYFSPSSQNQYSLAELTYIPASSVNTCVSIPFTATGAATGQSVKGSILISATKSIIQDVYGVTPKGTAVTFPASSLASAVAAGAGSTPAGFQLLELPAASVGAVYASADTSVPAATTQIYAYPSGTRPASSLRFVPAASYTGSVEIPYVALDSSGKAIGAGNLCMGVVNSVKRFSDVTSDVWCYKYVTELADASVVGGYPDGTYKPNNTVSYGAALKLIMLAAGYPEQAPTDSSSVFSGYLAKARADGIITRSDVNLTVPITRLQVAQIAAGAMKLDTGNLSSVQPFTDTTDRSVQALNAAGVINGYFENGVSTYRPQNNLSRGQVAAIVWRMRNYRNQ